MRLNFTKELEKYREGESRSDLTRRIDEVITPYPRSLKREGRWRSDLPWHGGLRDVRIC